MGIVRNFLISGGIKVLSAVLDILDSDGKSADGTTRRCEEDKKLARSMPDVRTSKGHADETGKQKKQGRCKRCHNEILGGEKIDGKLVCDACAKIIRAEKKLGYSHGPGFGRLSKRTCARCGVDLLTLDADLVQTIHQKEYCDICSVKLREALEHSREVVEQVLAYMMKLFPDTTYEIDNDGEYWIKSPKNEHGHCINVWIDHEVTLGFADWHAHYSYNPSELYMNNMDIFYSHLNALVNNEMCAVDSYYKEDGDEYWGGSTLLSEDQLTEENLYSEFGVKKVVCSFWDASKDRTFVIRTGMYELTDDAFYSKIKEYPSCVLDYCLMKCKATSGTEDHRCQSGFRSSQFLQSREAVQFAMEKVCPLGFDMKKAKAEQIDAQKFLSVPDVPYKKTHKGGSCFIDEVVGDKLQYWFAFLEPPYGGEPVMRNGRVIQKGLTIEAFHEINHLLFPNGPEVLNVMEWTTDWADYFDDGAEWWGTACWSIYDRSLDRYVVILASATD